MKISLVTSYRAMPPIKLFLFFLVFIPFSGWASMGRENALSSVPFHVLVEKQMCR